MSTRKRIYNYRCDNDCKQSGCPSHKLVALLQDTSDIVIIENENGDTVFSGDINKCNALIDVLHSLDYQDRIYFPTIDGLNEPDSFEDVVPTPPLTNKDNVVG